MARVERNDEVFLVCDTCGQEYPTKLKSVEGQTPKGFLHDKETGLEICSRCKEYRREDD